ncbi:glycerate kinase [Virgibacillus sp. NKC19-3]|uniref:glycerate kinase n=1 Tax=Virgibacillus saliphilus TaxID=2831674 RepID=UPI001C9BB075|nr:glycerate kinase [Virgibacillus sp. NKC19-3]MBY7144570.1 glycerate kinase [Virgibacillus sp. NKC19-3]
MNIIIAADSFKGSATSFEVAEFIEKGIKRVEPSAIITKLPLADGGEGTVDALVTALNGKYLTKQVTNPLGEKVTAEFGVMESDIAVIAMAEASGLTLIKNEDKNPFKTTTYGTGELIKAALDYGVKEIFVGIGGSATNDAGVGMAQALGVSFKDRNHKEIGFGAEALESIEYIDASNIDRRIKDTKITVFSDVTNPLCGKNGASYVYGPQKGASDEDVEKLDQLLSRYGKILEEQLNIDIIDNEGAGAAGGLGAGLIAFCEAEIYSGIDKVLKMIKLEKYMKSADLVITGEGKMDFQSVQGKAPLGVAKIAKQYKIPVVAVVGSEGANIIDVYNHGIDLVIDIINKPMSLNEAMEDVNELIENAGEKVIRAFTLNNKQFKIEEELV